MVPWYRPVVLLAALLLAASACASPDPAPAPDAGAVPIVECGLSALAGPLASNPNALQRAAQVYELVSRGRDVVAAVQEVFRTPVGGFSPAQIDEALFILSGLAACGQVSPMLRQSAVGAIGMLRSIAGSTPPGAATGPVLCPDLDPYGPPGSLRFQPDCGDLTGDWLLARTELTCENFPKGCAATSIPIRIADCTGSGCTVSRTDGVWTAAHPLGRGAGGLRGEFVDIGIECEGRRNRATITLDLTPAAGDPTTLRGSYGVAAATNPPDCTADARATYAVVGRRR